MSVRRLPTRSPLGNRRRLVVAASLLVMAIVAAVVVIRATSPPPDAIQTAQRFAETWNAGNFKGMYAALSTPIAEDVFVDALTHSAAPVQDVRLVGYARLDDRRVVATYSARVPDLASAVGAVVFANRLRYSDACMQESQKRAVFQRIEDTLDLEADGTGTWRVGLRGDSEFLQEGARLLALSFDLAPGFIWTHITADADPTTAAYDQQVVYEAKAAYSRDLGPLARSTEVADSAILEHLSAVSTSCAPSATR